MKKTSFPPQINAFLCGERQLILPFMFKLGDESYQCLQLLRLLPGKRFVCKAKNLKGDDVVLKCFSREKDYARELRGYQWLMETDINTPKLLKQFSESGFHVLVFKYLSHEKVTKNKTFLRPLFRFLAQLHQYGLYQSDMHFDNVFFIKGKPWLIDLASLKRPSNGGTLSKTTCLKNLATLIAQYTLSERSECFDCVADYFSESSLEWEEEDKSSLLKEVDQRWKSRKRHFMNKRLRNCTDTQFYSGSKWLYSADRKFWSLWQPKSLEQIEALFQGSKILKAGNTATVICTEIVGKAVVVKRYNIKSWRHWLSRVWRPSRAYHSWMNAHLLEFIGIPTPKPLAFIEKRNGWFRSTAYFICERIEGEEMLDYYQNRKPEKTILSQIKALFSILKQAKIAHGDMKAQNLLVSDNGQVLLIDLDGMKACRTNYFAEKLFLKDINRFLKNWQNPTLKKQFKDILMPLSRSKK